MAQIPGGIRLQSAERQFISLGGFKSSVTNDADCSTEFGDAYEPFVKGRGASSTMPQKRNPISSELMFAAAKAVRQHAGLMVDPMIRDFERAPARGMPSG